MTVKIRQEIAADAVPMDQVTPSPGNARRGDIPKIKTSLLKHGQYKQILAQRSTGHILIGNNTYAAMRELDAEQVAVTFLDVDDERARQMLLIDNASSDDAIYDETALAALLAEVEDWDASGWVPDDLDDLLHKLQEVAGDPEKLAAALPPPVESAPTDARYAETDDETAARQEKYDSWRPRHTQGLTEVILVYPEDDRLDLLAMIAAGKKDLGGDGVKSGDVVMSAVRLLTAVLDADRQGTASLDVGMLLDVAKPPVREEQPAAAEEQPNPAEDQGAPDAAGQG
jgi:ParB-like chromosome segregation protein Spo0J